MPVAVWLATRIGMKSKTVSGVPDELLDQKVIVKFGEASHAFADVACGSKQPPHQFAPVMVLSLPSVKLMATALGLCERITPF